VCRPFGSKIISTLPREQTLVQGSSFGDRFVEGIYLFADSTSPAIHTWDSNRKQEMISKDCASYPMEIPFKRTLLLGAPKIHRRGILQMHKEDLAEEERIVAELAAHAVMRSQSAQLAATQMAAAEAPLLVVPSSIASIPAREPIPAAPLSVAVPCKVKHLDSSLTRQ
jgi:hypothetical protein